MGLNLLSIGLKGYQYDVHDQHATVPVLKKRIAPQLYPRDLLMSAQQNAFSLFDVAMAVPARWVGVEHAFFWGYLVATSVSAVLLWRIAGLLFANRNAALLAAVACLCMKSVQGGMMQVYDAYYTYRTAAFPFTLAAYYFMMQRRLGWAALCGGVELSLHPLTAVSTALTLAVVACLERYWGRVRSPALLAAGGVYAACAAVLALRILSSTESAAGGLLQPMTREWLRIVVARTPYMFYSFWPLSARLYLFVFPCAFAAFFARPGRGQAHTVAAVGVAAGIALNLCAMLFADLFVLPLAVKLHLETARRVVSMFAVLYMGAGLWRLIEMAACAWARRRAGFAVAAAKAWAVLVLVGWLVSSDGVYSHWDLQNPDQAKLILKWLLPYGLLLGLALPRAASPLWAVPLAALAAGASVYAGLGPFLVCAAAGMAALWQYRRRPHRAGATAAVLLALALGAALNMGWHAMATGAEGLRTGWVRIPGATPATFKSGLATWMREHTPVDALIMVPPGARGLRIHGERSLFLTGKDGGPVIYSEAYAREWSERMRLLDRYSELGESQFLYLVRRYGVDFVVTQPPHELGFALVYQSPAFRVYDVRQFRGR